MEPHHQFPLTEPAGYSSPAHNSPRTDDAWALALHVADQVPLEICYPSDDGEDKTPPELSDGENVGNWRRSLPEDRGAVSGRVRKNAKLGSGDGMILRRSHRLKGDTNGDSGQQVKSAGKCFLSDKCLRSRTVLMHKVEKSSPKESRSIKCLLGAPLLKHAPVKSHASSSDDKCLRSRSRSRLLKVKVGNEKKKEESASKELSSTQPEYSLIELSKEMAETDGAMIEFPENMSTQNDCGESSKAEKLGSLMLLENGSLEKDGCEFHEKRILMSPKIESILDELFGDYEERDLEKCDSDVLSEECLESGKLKRKLNEDQNSEKTTSQVEGGRGSKSKCSNKKSAVCCFVGEPIPKEVAQDRWRWRYELKDKKKGGSWKINADEEDEIILNVDCHYAQAKVSNCVLDIGNCVYVKGEGTKKHIGRILEFFKTTQAEDYFRVQWFFRAEDTVLKDAGSSRDKKRLFYSTLMNDNILDCIISKVNVVKIPPTLCLKQNPVRSTAFYYDMEYSVEYSTFRTLINDISEPSIENQSFSSNLNYPDDRPITMEPLAALPNIESLEPELALLDLYSGCGGMSTGLCLGAKLSSVNLVTKWAVDYDSSACDSLRLNHPETHVRNVSADDFLELLKQWEKLCKLHVSDLDWTLRSELEDSLDEDEASTTQSINGEFSGEYEVLHLVDICYGDPNNNGKCGLHFKVRWKGYGSDDDTWEPVEGLSNCQERIQEFVLKGFKSKLLPLPGDADVICGGPPCQGISGYNRFRNFDSPLSDERNRQIIVFMDIVEFLKPKYALMENVVDIIRFDKGSLARYALSRLVQMKYQARLGTMASGCYGLPQFRLRVFIWGAGPTEKLPQFPLPTHDVIMKSWPPIEFERNTVGYIEGETRVLEEAVVLRDAFSDLQPVGNDEAREEMEYLNPPETDFQNIIRLSKDSGKLSVLYDHRPLILSENDYLRVSQIPKRKGANFRDLTGIIVEDNVAYRDPKMEPVLLPTGNLLVPDCALNFEKGKSKRPYARLWWDETVSTILTFPNIRTQAILHPEQDRVLTIRECARLQGFPDYYRFCGTIRERYRQVGNAVSIPAARALGFALGMAHRKVIGDEPLMSLPEKFCSRVA